MTDRGKRCRYHCAVCDAHFTSLAGFDAHKPSVYGCRTEPRNTELTEYIQVPGTCDLTKGKIGQGIECSIWKNAREDTRFHQNKSKLDLIPDEVSPYPACESPLESVGGTSESIVATLNECRVCGKTIQPTHRRGRPRRTHLECR